MTSDTFAMLTNQVHLLNDFILSDMVCDHEQYLQAAEAFAKHLHTTRWWFIRTSYANKKRFILALLRDLRSGWALSLILKSIWNCRTKDAVLSFWHKPKALTAYDQIPMDHNRSMQPLQTLAQVMSDERRWFHSLNPEAQAMLLLDLLSLTGTPLMLEVLRRGQSIYEFNRDLQLTNISEEIKVADYQSVKIASKEPAPEVKPRKSTTSRTAVPVKSQIDNIDDDRISTSSKATPVLKAQKQLEANLAEWDAVIKKIQTSQKLEEVEMTFKDGTKKKIWKVERPKPEAIVTNDFFQLLPGSIARRIMSYLPKQTLHDVSQVNKYWAFLVETYDNELRARDKLDHDLDKLRNLVLQHDTSITDLEVMETGHAAPNSLVTSSIGPSDNNKDWNKSAKYKSSTKSSIKSSIKSSQSGHISYRNFFEDKMKTKYRVKNKAIQNLADLQERLDQRGAADESLWFWCNYMAKISKSKKVLPLDSTSAWFPTPMLHQHLELPLKVPNKQDPALAFFLLLDIGLPNTTPSFTILRFPHSATTGHLIQVVGPPSRVLPKKKKDVHELDSVALGLPKEPVQKRYSLWSRDFSSLYKAYKVPAYKSPI